MILLLNSNMSLTEVANTKYLSQGMRYLGGHFHERVHNEYAKYLIKKCLKI
jgi:hypothetical protein